MSKAGAATAKGRSASSGRQRARERAEKTLRNAATIADKRISKMGVHYTLNASGQGRDAALVLLHATLARLRRQGVDVRGLKFDMRDQAGWAWAVGGGKFYAQYQEATRTVELNLTAMGIARGGLRGERPELKRGAATGWWAGSHRTNTFLHETGHALHYRNLDAQGERFRHVIPKTALPSFGATQRARQVSEYATHSNTEFVAETFAALVSGRRYAPDVIRQYKEYGGPAFRARHQGRRRS